MNRIIKYSLLACLILTFVTSCNEINDGTCHKDGTVRAGLAFYKTIYSEDKEAYVTSSVSEMLTIQGVGNDSVLYKAKTMSSCFLPLRIQTDSTEYVLQRDSTGIDTLTIYHTNTQTFISMECGCFVYHNITNVKCTTNQIDSVIISNSAVQNTTDNNLKIYYRVK